MFNAGCLPEHDYENMCTRELFIIHLPNSSLSLLYGNDCILAESVFFYLFVERPCFFVAKLVIISTGML